MFWELSLSFYIKIEYCINTRDTDHFVFRSAWSAPSIESWNQRLVVRRRPSGPPLTASRFHIEVSFPNWSLNSIYNSDNSCFTSSQSCRIYNRNSQKEITRFAAYCELFLKVVFRNLSAESVLYSSSSYNCNLMELLLQTFRGPHDTSVQLMFDKFAKPATSRFYSSAYFLNWLLVSICIWSDSGLVSRNNKVSLRIVEISILIRQGKHKFTIYI
jgi:hypothetical protein